MYIYILFKSYVHLPVMGRYMQFCAFEAKKNPRIWYANLRFRNTPEQYKFGLILYKYMTFCNTISNNYVIKFVNYFRQVVGFRHDITEILLKMALNTITLTLSN